MCAIVDASVIGEVFGRARSRTPAAQKFFEWLNAGTGILVIGGKLRSELERSKAFRGWALTAIQTGKLVSINDDSVNTRAGQLREFIRKQDDPHVIALAQISGARLLYSNDRGLIQHFKDEQFISCPQGSIYTTLTPESLPEGEFTREHEDLLLRSDLCRM